MFHFANPQWTRSSADAYKPAVPCDAFRGQSRSPTIHGTSQYVRYGNFPISVR